MGNLYVTIYCLPISTTMLMLLAGTVAWRFLYQWYRRHKRQMRLVLRAAGAVFFALWLMVILHMTIFSRTPGEREAELVPLHQLWVYFSGGNKEILRTLWMNVLLFAPGGLLLTALWPEKWRYSTRFWLTAAVLTAVSAGIEWTQFRLALGLAETDDVLCNGLGAMLGALMHRSALPDPGEA